MTLLSTARATAEAHADRASVSLAQVPRSVAVWSDCGVGTRQDRDPDNAGLALRPWTSRGHKRVTVKKKAPRRSISSLRTPAHRGDFLWPSTAVSLVSYELSVRGTLHHRSCVKLCRDGRDRSSGEFSHGLEQLADCCVTKAEPSMNAR